MKCDSSEIRYIKFLLNSNGSVSVETAVLMPFIFLVFFMFFSFLQYCAAYLNISQAADVTARYMSYYACVYYEQGIEKINGFAADKIYNKFGEDGLAATRFLQNLSDSEACSVASEKLFEMNLEKNLSSTVNKFYKIKNISFTGSSFFTDGNDFTLNVSCLVDTLFPLPEFFGKDYIISLSIKANGWTDGAYSIKERNTSVWELDNFERGKAIEEYLGCNLPYDYPLIDMYDKKSGVVTLVRSVDHTRYIKTADFISVLDDCLEKVKRYNGSDVNASKTGNSIIKASDVKGRRIILVVPTNDMTRAQIKAVTEFTSDCVIAGVEFVLEKYQVSY